MDGPMGAAHAHHQVGPSAWSRVGNFARHFGEMCLAMCLGLAVLDVVYVWAAGLLGVASPFMQYPELSALVLAFNMTAPMVAWMRFRGMAWLPIAEMSAAMVVEALLIVAALWLGIVANTAAVGNTTSLWWLQHALMMPLMLIPMLLRLDYYTGGMHHGGHAA